MLFFVKARKPIKKCGIVTILVMMGRQKYYGLGINAKMSELQAAMGLSVLPYMEHVLFERMRVCDYYDKHINFSSLKKLRLRDNTKWNYAYYPIIFNSEESLLNAVSRFRESNIFPRRYFFPSLEELPYINSNECIIAEDKAKKVLCLPLYTDLNEDDLKRITSILNHEF